MDQPTQLKPSQIKTLKQLYKFRFVTAKHLSAYRNLKDQYSSYRALETLTKLGYVLKRHDPSYRIDRKSANYSLSKKGIQYLRDTKNFSEIALHAMYRNPSISNDYTAEHIDILQLAARITHSYPKTFDIFTRVELIDQDYFPDPRPEMYLRRHDYTHKPNELMLFMVNDVLRFVFVKKFKSWLSHFEEEGWDGDYPTVLLVCITSSVEARVRSYLLNIELDDELQIFLTTKKAALAGIDSEIWTDYRTDQMIRNLN